MPDGIGWGGKALDALHGVVQGRNQFIAADEQNHVPGTEGDAGHPVAHHVQVDQHPGFRDGIGSREKQIGEQGLPAALQSFFR